MNSQYLFALILALALPLSAAAQAPAPGPDPAKAPAAQTAGQAATAPKVKSMNASTPDPGSERPDMDMEALLAKGGKKGGRVSDPLPSSDYLSRSSIPLTAKERQAIKLAETWEAQGAPPISANGKVLYTFGATYPTVIGVPNLICDIELQPGENVNEVVIGDSARWIADTAKSGTTTHVLVKPVDAGLMTSAVITTDRRVYHLKLISQRAGLTPYVGFLYPEDQGSGAGLRQKLSDAKEAREKEQRMKALEPEPSDPSKLNFSYDIKGDTPWKPLQVYDDGRQTYINFPSTIQSGDAPVLLVRNGGQDTLANFRMKGTSMVVDGVFPEMALLAGVGMKQQRITVRAKR